MEELAHPDILAGRVPARGAVAEGFDALFRREFPRVARTLHHIVGDRARAEEVTQDAFLELLRPWSTVSHYDRPDLWVRRVAIRKAQRERHRAWRRIELERGTLELVATEPVTPAPEVLAAVRRLAPKQRAIVVLFYFDDRPMAEIAEIVGCAESTGWSQLHTARRHLAAELAEEVTGDVRATLREAGLGEYAGAALAGLPEPPFRIVFVVTGDALDLDLVSASGTDRFDEETLVVHPRRLELYARQADGRSVHRWELVDGALRMEFVATDEPATDGVPGEVWQRILYDTAPFHR